MLNNYNNHKKYKTKKNLMAVGESLGIPLFKSWTMNKMKTTLRSKVAKPAVDVNALLPDKVDEEELDAEEVAANSVGVCSNKDTYTSVILIEQYELHKNYVEKRIESAKKLKVNIRLPVMPEDISENLIKFIIHKLGDKTSSWNCKGDLLSKVEGVQECKCFTSDGPLSFSPSTNWDVIYFLDARGWLKDKFILYRINLTKISDAWKNIKVSKKQSFDDQVKQGRRPRISWRLLSAQLPEENVAKVFEGSFGDVFRASAGEAAGGPL